MLFGLKNFVTDLRVVDSINKPLMLFCDNEAITKYLKNEKLTKHNKHIDIKYFFVCEKVREGVIEVLHIDTGNMIADPFTKSLPPKVFKDHVTRMGVCESLPCDM